MDTVEGGKNKKKEDGEKVASKEEEEEALRKDAEDLKSWIDMIEKMNDQEIKDYLENNAEDIKLAKVPKPKKKVQRTRKSKPSTSSNGILASVWRFHQK
ncbi:hypothetical protein VNO80_13374 [Phaseolus coccineus]|uniref:Uncharacterized protein n=1 Tax=Phaseolus coccineus TaxID=3886 RepID=A0AAN9N0V3_PHACN